MLAALAGFALCFAILASGWMARLMGWQRVLVRSSPYEPSAEAFAHYLAEVAVHLDEKPEPLVMTLDGGGSAHELDFLPDGRMAVSVEGAGRHVFSLRRRWLPDHEVPLRFGEGGSSITLYATPDRGSRFRVRRSLELSEKRLLLAAGIFAFVLFSPSSPFQVPLSCFRQEWHWGRLRSESSTPCAVTWTACHHP